MGMSASQARLLSITTRLTNNEFRAQTITNSKLRLAEKSEEASAEYMDALNSQTLNFRYYNSNGDAQTYKLTPAFLYSYENLKSQYAIQNTSGQYLVSQVDADNFENSKTLYDFLGKYGLTDNSEWLAYKVKDEEYTDANEDYKEKLEKYNSEDEVKRRAEWDKYNKELEEYNKKYEDWQKQWAQYKVENKIYTTEHEAWKDGNTEPDLSKLFIDIVGTSEKPNSRSCYDDALNNYGGNGFKCYLHILNHLLDFDGAVKSNTYTTSTGQKVTTNNEVGALNNDNRFVDISKALNNAENTPFCDGDDDFTTKDKKENVLDSTNYKALVEKMNDENASDEDKENAAKKIEILKLKSDYVFDGTESNGNNKYKLKTLKQKAIDMYYIIQQAQSGNYVITDEERKEMLINFTEGDMKNLSTEPQPPVAPPSNPPEQPTAPENKPIEKPVKPEEPVKPAFKMNLIDGDKAQWYVNLWHLMNGSSTANVVRKRASDGSDEDFAHTAGKDYYQIEDCIKNAATETNFMVMEDNLSKSPEWLQFALENGIVTLVKAQYYNPSDNGGKVLDNDREGISWNSIIYTNAPDLSYVDNETAIAIAEVKYKNAVSEIETKDKKYDQDLKKLDTEHTALQTEYESIKGVIDKNVERSFKAFS